MRVLVFRHIRGFSNCIQKDPVFYLNASGEQRRQLDLLRQLNEDHQRERAHDSRLEARLQSFELAYRMQMEASDAFDISKEPEEIRKMYGNPMLKVIASLRTLASN